MKIFLTMQIYEKTTLQSPDTLGTYFDVQKVIYIYIHATLWIRNVTIIRMGPFHEQVITVIISFLVVHYHLHPSVTSKHEDRTQKMTASLL